MSKYAKFMKDLLTKKRRIEEEETLELEVGYNAIIQKSLPLKSRDLRSFTLLVTIDSLTIGKALLNLGISINLMPLSMLRRIGDVEMQPTRMTLTSQSRKILLSSRFCYYGYGGRFRSISHLNETLHENSESHH